MVWRGCLVLDSYDEWYGVVWRGCLVLDSYESGMERMSCFIHMIHILDSYESGMERMSCFRFI